MFGVQNPYLCMLYVFIIIWRSGKISVHVLNNM